MAGARFPFKNEFSYGIKRQYARMNHSEMIPPGAFPSAFNIGCSRLSNEISIETLSRGQEHSTPSG